MSEIGWIDGSPVHPNWLTLMTSASESLSGGVPLSVTRIVTWKTPKIEGVQLNAPPR
jgi:hypothetical protein